MSSAVSVRRFSYALPAVLPSSVWRRADIIAKFLAVTYGGAEAPVAMAAGAFGNRGAAGPIPIREADGSVVELEAPIVGVTIHYAPGDEDLYLLDRHHLQGFVAEGWERHVRSFTFEGIGQLLQLALAAGRWTEHGGEE